MLPITSLSQGLTPVFFFPLFVSKFPLYLWSIAGSLCCVSVDSLYLFEVSTTSWIWSCVFILECCRHYFWRVSVSSPTSLSLFPRTLSCSYVTQRLTLSHRPVFCCYVLTLISVLSLSFSDLFWLFFLTHHFFFGCVWSAVKPIECLTVWGAIVFCYKVYIVSWSFLFC